MRFRPQLEQLETRLAPCSIGEQEPEPPPPWDEITVEVPENEWWYEHAEDLSDLIDAAEAQLYALEAEIAAIPIDFTLAEQAIDYAQWARDQYRTLDPQSNVLREMEANLKNQAIGARRDGQSRDLAILNNDLARIDGKQIQLSRDFARFYEASRMSSIDAAFQLYNYRITLRGELDQKMSEVSTLVQAARAAYEAGRPELQADLRNLIQRHYGQMEQIQLTIRAIDTVIRIP